MGKGQKMSKKLKNFFSKLPEKIKETGSNIVFFFKGVDTEEDVNRIIRLTILVGSSVFILLLAGVTVRFVVIQNRNQDRNQDRNERVKQSANSKVGVTESVDEKIQENKGNVELQTQYAKLLEKVEQLNKDESSLVFQEKIMDLLGSNEYKGKDGKQGEAGINGTNGIDGRTGNGGKDGINGVDGMNGVNGKDGIDGKSVYELAKEAGFSGSEDDLSKTLAGVEDRTADVENRLIAIEEKNVLIQDRITGTEDRLLNVENKLVNLEERMTGAEEHLINLDGDMEQLKNEVDETKKSVADGKTLISSALTDHRVITASDAAFQEMADHIDSVYNNGYIDGQKNITDHLNVEYTYHYHDGNSESGGGCYTKAVYKKEAVYGHCPCTTANWTGGVHHSGTHYRDYWACPECGSSTMTWDSDGSEGDSIYYSHQSAKPTGYVDGSTVDHYEPGCGHEDGQILSATITY